MLARPVGALALVTVVAGGCLGIPDPATESSDGSALSADGRRMRLIYRNRGWAEGKQTYELYSKIPYVSSGSVTIMGLRLAMPVRWADNTPVSLYTFDTRWWSDAEMGLALYHRAEGTNGNWIPFRCAAAGAAVPSNANDLQYFHATQALIDLQAGEVELVPVDGSGVAATPTDSSFERDDYDSQYADDSRGGRDLRTPTNVTVSTFAQCGITETSPEFSAFVFPYSVARWDERFDYDFAARCDGDPCPAYRGDPNEPRRNGNNNGGGVIPGNNGGGGIVNPDPYRLAWDVTDDSIWQCGRTNVVGAGNVAQARVEVRGRHAQTGQLEATLKKVGGTTNVPLFSTNSGLFFPITRTVATSNELWAGTWELCLRDTIRGEMGRVDGWSLYLDQAPGGAGGNNGGAVQPGVVAVTSGTSRNDSIENGVQDWFSISLNQGQTLTAATSGSCSNDGAAPVVSIHSTLPVARPTWSECPANGSAPWTASSTLACADEDEDDYCTTAELRAPSTATYYVRVIGYDDENPGTYTIAFNVR